MILKVKDATWYYGLRRLLCQFTGLWGRIGIAWYRIIAVLVKALLFWKKIIVNKHCGSYFVSVCSVSTVERRWNSRACVTFSHDGVHSFCSDCCVLYPLTHRLIWIMLVSIIAHHPSVLPALSFVTWCAQSIQGRVYARQQHFIHSIGYIALGSIRRAVGRTVD